MKRVAFISDIHSNLPALEATLTNIKESGITDIYCLGDIIGYHSYPNEVISLLRENGVISIMGNHDKAITEESFSRERESDFVLWWNFDALTEDSLNYLKSLPFSLEIDIEDISIKIVHGSPESIEEYIREDSIEAHKYLDTMNSDILISGHTHIPYIIEEDGKFLLNTGSVGKPKWGNPDSAYIELEISGNRILPTINRVPYNIEIMVNNLKENGFPNKLIEALKIGTP